MLTLFTVAAYTDTLYNQVYEIRRELIAICEDEGTHWLIKNPLNDIINMPHDCDEYGSEY
jgi:hypothetical protein